MGSRIRYDWIVVPAAPLLPLDPPVRCDWLRVAFVTVMTGAGTALAVMALV